VTQHKTFLIGDGHVHIHACFDLDTFWESAWHNFSQAASRYAQDSPVKAVLFLTECQGVNRFADFKQQANETEQKGLWKFQQAGESRCLRVYNEAGAELWLVAGRQIITAEKLEILGLGVEQHCDDGKPLAEVVDWVHAQAGMAVIPWGAGKWTGARGAYVRALVENATANGFLLGDNGNRPVFWSLPSLFARGRARGVVNLPGSDPLPFPQEARRPGSYGFMLPEFQYGNEPVKDMIAQFARGAQRLRTYGEPENMLRFVKHQCLMQLIKRRK